MDNENQDNPLLSPPDKSEEPNRPAWQEQNKEADNALDEVLRNSGLTVKPPKLFPTKLTWTAEMF